MKTYKISPSGNSKIAAALCRFCQPGQIGESLIRNGCSQSAFALFIARLAHKLVDAGKTEEETAQAFELVSACNASAAKQALANCDLFAEELGSKNKAGELQAVTLETYWKSLGEGRASASNLSLFEGME